MSITFPRIAALAAIGCLAAATPAGARHAGGAGYAGTYGDGAGQIRFTVSADGRRLTSYRISDVAGDTCRFYAQGDSDQWETPIDQERFEYRLYDAILFRGTFGADAVASGTFRLRSDAVPGVKPACDTGVIAWTATATTGAADGGGPVDGSGAAGGSGAADGAGTAGDPGAGGQTPVAGSGKPGATTLLRTGVSRVGRSATRISGRLSSPGAACRRGRTVLLRRGARTVATATSKADGTFSFARRRTMRGQTLSIRVLSRTVPSAICGAAASKRFKA
jgi:hypothetical protein